MATIDTLPLNVAKGVGLMLTGFGIYALAAPQPFTVFFGLPQARNDARYSLLATGIGARNLAVGLATLLCSFGGEQRAVGILLGFYMLAGLSDTWICYYHGTKSKEHLLPTALLGVASYLNLG